VLIDPPRQGEKKKKGGTPTTKRKEKEGKDDLSIFPSLEKKEKASCQPAPRLERGEKKRGEEKDPAGPAKPREEGLWGEENPVSLARGKKKPL